MKKVIGAFYIYVIIDSTESMKKVIDAFYKSLLPQGKTIPKMLRTTKKMMKLFRSW